MTEREQTELVLKRITIKPRKRKLKGVWPVEIGEPIVWVNPNVYPALVKQLLQELKSEG